MKNSLKALAIGIALAGLGSVQAEEAAQPADSWYIGAGLSYRVFPRIDFNAVGSGTGYGYSLTAPTDGNYVKTGSVADAKAAAVAAMPAPTVKPADGSPVYRPFYIAEVTSTSGSGNKSWDFLGCLSPVLTAGLPVYQDGDLRIDVVSNLQYYSCDYKMDLYGNGSGRYYQTNIVFQAPSYNAGIVETFDPDAFNAWKSFAYNDFAGRCTLNIWMLELDLGGKAKYAIADKLSAIGAFGPSITFADIDSSCGSLESNSRQWIWGLYAAVGVEYQIDDKWGLEFDVRYDKAFGDAATAFARADLTSLSFQLKAVYQF